MQVWCGFFVVNSFTASEERKCTSVHALDKDLDLLLILALLTNKKST